jgi:hypothetical protein
MITEVSITKIFLSADFCFLAIVVGVGFYCEVKITGYKNGKDKTGC